MENIPIHKGNPNKFSIQVRSALKLFTPVLADKPQKTGAATWTQPGHRRVTGQQTGRLVICMVRFPGPNLLS